MDGNKGDQNQIILLSYYTIAPPPQLADIVRFYWVFEYDIPAGEPYVYRSMAESCAEMIFHYKGAFDELDEQGNISSSHLSGIHAQTQHYRRFVTRDNFGIFGAYLYPFAIPLLLNTPATDLSNQMPGLDLLWGSGGKELEEQMMLAADNNIRANLLSAFLERKLNRDRQKNNIHLAVKQVVHAKDMVNVQQLSSDFCLSTRQFERKFKELSGFSPKTYARIARFQSTLKAYGTQYRTLADIAYDSGYYDQSHFIHDFKAFSGYHPKQYFLGRPEGIEYREA